MKGGLDVTIGVDGKIPGCLAGGILRCSQANLRVHLRAIPVLEFLGEITAVSLLILFCCCCSAHFYLSNPHSPASNFRWNPSTISCCLCHILMQQEPDRMQSGKYPLAEHLHQRTGGCFLWSPKLRTWHVRFQSVKIQLGEHWLWLYNRYIYR